VPKPKFSIVITRINNKEGCSPGRTLAHCERIAGFSLNAAAFFNYWV